MLGLALGFALAGAVESAPAAEPLPVMFQSAPGRFEVAAVEPNSAQRVVAQAEAAWFHLATPLALPGAFSSSVLVRLIPATDWAGSVPFRVIVEAGGLVSVRLRWSEDLPEAFVRRALVQGLLMRLAVSQHGVTERLTAPLWLEHACVAWWRTHADPAQLDAVKLSSARSAPPSLDALLDWQRGDDEPAPLTDGALWLLAFLQSESGRNGEWTTLRTRLLGGEPAAAALAATFGGKFSSAAERELWWQTGWHQLRRARVLPALDAAESRTELAALARFVFLQRDVEGVTPLRDVLAHAREPEVDAELRRRAATLARFVPVLHPYYRNAGLSLAEVLAPRAAGTADQREVLVAAFETDWRDAGEIEAATKAALDALELRQGRAR